MSLKDKIVRFVTSVVSVEDVLLTETGPKKINVHEMIAKGESPESPPCLLVTAKHWGFISRQYIVAANLWAAGIIIDVSNVGNNKSRAEAFADFRNRMIFPEKSRFFKAIAVAISGYSEKMLREITQVNHDKDGNPVSAEVINLAERRPTVH